MKYFLQRKQRTTTAKLPLIYSSLSKNTKFFWHGIDFVYRAQLVFEKSEVFTEMNT